MSKDFASQLHAERPVAGALSARGSRHRTRRSLLAASLLAAAAAGHWAGAADHGISVDAAGRPVVISGPGQSSSRLSYDAQSRLSRIVEPDGAATELVYDEAGRVSELHGADGLVQEFSYAPQGRLAGMREDGVEVLTLSYDANGRVDAVGGRGGVRRRLEYGADGRLAAIIDGTGRRIALEAPAALAPDDKGSTFSFDPQTQRVTFAGPGGGSSIVFDAEGRPVLETDRFGLSQRRGYDAAGRLERIEHADGRVETLRYDASGRPARATDGLGAVIETTWSRYGKPARLVVNGVLRETRSYDRDRLTAVTDGAGGTTGFQLDEAGRPRLVTGPGGDAAAYAWDAEGELLSSLAPNGYRLGFAYRGPAEQPTEIQLGNGASIKLEYDGEGRLVRRTGADGQVVRFNYDAQGRLAEELVNDQHIALRRDAAGHLIEVDDPSAPAYWSYDAAGRLSAVTGLGGKVGYELTPEGLVRSVTAPSGAVLQWRYDALLRPCGVKLPGGAGEIEFHWLPGGRLGEIRLPNRVVGKWTYAPDGRLRSLDWTTAAGKPVAGWQLAYDRRGLPVSAATPQGDVKFDYDGDGRLTGERSAAANLAYAYAAGGDRTERRDGGKQQSYAYRDGRLSEWNGSAVAYDGEDRITALGGVVLSWDGLGRLAARRDADGSIAFGYDLFGNLVSADGAGGRTRFAYDRGELLEATGPRGERVLYVHAPGLDRPVAVLSQGQWRFLVTDWTGSVVASLDAGGKVLARYRADAFGAGDFGAARDLGIAFQGRPCFAAARLCWFRQRWYAPELGRFLSPDPQYGTVEDPQSLNAFAFARNAPTAYTDPYGAAPWSIGVDYGLESRRTGVPEQVLRDLARELYAKARTPDASGQAASARVAAQMANMSIREQADWVWHMRNGTYGSAQPLSAEQAVNIMRSNLRLEPPSVVTPAAGSASNPAISAPPPQPPLPAQPAAGGASGGVVDPNEAAIGELFEPPAPAPPRGSTLVVERAPVDPAAPPRIPTLAVNNRPAPAGPGAAEPASGSAAGEGLTVRGVAAGLAVGAVVSGVTQSANCYARGGTAAQCAQAFGTGAGTGIAGGVIGTLVIGGTAAVIKATAGAAAATAFGGAAALTATGVGFYGAGNAVGGAANTAIYGSAAQAQASAAALASLDPRIAELGDLDRAAKETLAEPLKKAKDLDAEFGGLIAGKAANPPAAAAVADQSLSEACAAARAGLDALDQIAAAVADPALDAFQRLRDAQSPADAADDTKIAIEVVKHAVYEGRELGKVGALTAEALKNAAEGLRRSGATDSAEAWRAKVAAYNEAIQALSEAADAAAERRRQFVARKAQFAADAQALRPNVRDQDQAAFSRRTALIDGAEFTSAAVIDEARAEVRSAPQVMAMAVKAIERSAAAGAGNADQREAACARFQERGVAAAANGLREGALKRLDADFSRIATAIDSRAAKIQDAEARNTQLLSGAQAKVLQARAAGDAKTAAAAQRLLDSAKIRQAKVLQPQNAAIAEGRAAIAPVRSAIQSTQSALAGIAP